MMERYEEMNRMREHVFKEVDKDKDSMISFNEFIQSTQGKDFEKDEGWDVSVPLFLYVCLAVASYLIFILLLKMLCKIITRLNKLQRGN